MTKRTDILNRIIAVIIILFLFIVFAQRTFRHHRDFINAIGDSTSRFAESGEGFSDRVYNLYNDVYLNIKGGVEYYYSYPPRVNEFNQVFYEYLRATGRGNYNAVALLKNGRLMTDNLNAIQHFPERTDSISGLHNYVTQKGMQFLYVRIPNKVQDNSAFTLPFSNNSIIQYGDQLMEMVGNRGIDTFDLRAEMNRDGLDFESSFYRKHLHWTNKTVLWASQKLGDLLNREYGFNIDLGVWDIGQYDAVTYEKILYGSEAYHVGAFFDLETITLLYPQFPVDIEKSDSNHGFQGSRSNSFVEIFLPDIYNGLDERFVCHNIRLPGSHFTHIINHAAAENKRVMLISDSFSLSWAMYLPLGFSHLDFVYLINHRTPAELYGFLEGKEYDLVILAVSDVTLSTEIAVEFEDDRLNLGTPPAG